VFEKAPNPPIRGLQVYKTKAIPPFQTLLGEEDRGLILEKNINQGKFPNKAQLPLPKVGLGNTPNPLAKK